ncbi:hypothetical protein K4G60_g233 [Candida parapsilosis]|nr:hypothetical protein K4G60_g233 [Candida parapsilosis]
MPEGLEDAMNESVWKYIVTKSKVTRYEIHDAGAKSKGLGFIFPDRRIPSCAYDVVFVVSCYGAAESLTSQSAATNSMNAKGA